MREQPRLEGVCGQCCIKRGRLPLWPALLLPVLLLLLLLLGLLPLLPVLLLLLLRLLLLGLLLLPTAYCLPPTTSRESLQLVLPAAS